MKYPRIKILKLETRNPREVFTLFAALNAMGYDDENNPKGMSPVRKRVRDALLKSNWGRKYPQLKKVVSSFHLWHLLNTVLAKSEEEIPAFSEFSAEKVVQKLWKTFKVHQEKELKQVAPFFKKETKRLLEFIGRPAPKVRKLVLIVNLLDAFKRGYGFTTKETGYIIVGPGATDNKNELIRHELLHVLAPKFRIPTNILRDQNHKQSVIEDYGNGSFLSREYVVRSLSLIYQSRVLKEDISRETKREEKDFPCIREVMSFIKTKLKNEAV